MMIYKFNLHNKWKMAQTLLISSKSDVLGISTYTTTYTTDFKQNQFCCVSCKKTNLTKIYKILQELIKTY